MTMARILIIEDNPDFVAFVCAVLELNEHGAHEFVARRHNVDATSAIS
jgi:hypothetical protein